MSPRTSDISSVHTYTAAISRDRVHTYTAAISHDTEYTHIHSCYQSWHRVYTYTAAISLWQSTPRFCMNWPRHQPLTPVPILGRWDLAWLKLAVALNCGWQVTRHKVMVAHISLDPPLLGCHLKPFGSFFMSTRYRSDDSLQLWLVVSTSIAIYYNSYEIM